MSQFSTKTVNDGAATPVARTFSIFDRTGLKSIFRDSAAALVRGMRTFTHTVVIGTQPKQSDSVRLLLNYPVEGEVDGQTVVVRTLQAEVNYRFAQGSPEDERKAFVGLFNNLLTDADVKDSVIKLYAAN
jgi:hypothetical protein